MELSKFNNVPVITVNKKNLYYYKYNYKLVIRYVYSSSSTKRKSRNWLNNIFLNNDLTDGCKIYDHWYVNNPSTLVYCNEALLQKLVNILSTDVDIYLSIEKIGELTVIEETMYFKRKPKHQYRIYFKSCYVNDNMQDFVEYFMEKYHNDLSLSYAMKHELRYYYSKGLHTLPNRKIWVRNNYYVDFLNEKRYIHFNLLYGEYISKRYKLEQLKHKDVVTLDKVQEIT